MENKNYAPPRVIKGDGAGLVTGVNRICIFKQAWQLTYCFADHLGVLLETYRVDAPLETNAAP